MTTVGEAQIERWGEGGEAFAGAVFEGTVLDAAGAVRLQALDPGRNLAAGQRAEDEFGRLMPFTDGALTAVTSEWISGTPNVFGRYFIVDLGRDRAIERVRVLSGETIRAQPEYFIRGYRLEAATQREPGLWRLLAEDRENFLVNIDTRTDSSWQAPAFRVGRFVRLTLLRQDRSNWVTIGEIEVFGTGLRSEGRVSGEFVADGPVNVGRLRWGGQRPQGTRVELQLRPAAASGDQEAWGFDGVHTEVGGLFEGAEPLSVLQYRAGLSSGDPFATPVLDRLEVEYDPVLVAARVAAAVTPSSVQKGESVRLTYGADIDVRSADYGVDRLRLEGIAIDIEAMRWDGRLLDPERDYTWSSQPEAGQVLIELAPGARLEAAGRLEIEGLGVFVVDRTPLRLAVASQFQAERDGYVNWQNAAEDADGTWTVRAFGAPPSLLSQVEVAPRPFSPFADGVLRINFVVANLQTEGRATVEVFTLGGERVRRLEQSGQARAYRFEWDGRDDRGRVVEPGLYIYEVRLRTGGDTARRRGTAVVAY